MCTVQMVGKAQQLLLLAAQLLPDLQIQAP
jgi:hypothetical protein